MKGLGRSILSSHADLGGICMLNCRVNGRRLYLKSSYVIVCWNNSTAGPDGSSCRPAACLPDVQASLGGVTEDGRAPPNRPTSSLP
ncbi:hypothetical protein CEXT_161301 [Caerostris extrusa]|uniref:Uncharacterized protein n=1 Tax=Caerostris extrusa TaxID=172846 RepID=A0AAV4V7P3_CAEEX|nr:hypothetical protein CEXT_161301 [Caerostris extrusa]